MVFCAFFISIVFLYRFVPSKQRMEQLTVRERTPDGTKDSDLTVIANFVTLVKFYPI